MESIGEKIRRIRKSKGISQITVAEECGIKQSSYANIENGKTQNITIEIGKGISKALDISFNELFEIELPKSQTDPLQELNKEVERQKEEIRMKSMLIDLLKNAEIHLREEFTLYLNQFCYFRISSIDSKISETENKEEITKLNLERIHTIDFYLRFKEKCINENVLLKSDFEEDFNSSFWLYKNMPDNELLR